MTSDAEPQVSALAINVDIPAALQWTDVRRGVEFTLLTLNVRLLPDGRLAPTRTGGRRRAAVVGTPRSRCLRDRS